MSHNFFPRFPPWPCAGVGGVKGKKQTAASATLGDESDESHHRWPGPLTAPRVSSGCGVSVELHCRSVTSHINTRYRHYSQVSGALSWYLLSTSWGVHWPVYPAPLTINTHHAGSLPCQTMQQRQCRATRRLQTPSFAILTSYHCHILRIYLHFYTMMEDFQQ